MKAACLTYDVILGEFLFEYLIFQSFYGTVWDRRERFWGNYFKRFRPRKDLINRGSLNIYFYLENNLSLLISVESSFKLILSNSGSIDVKGPKIYSFIYPILITATLLISSAIENRVF